MTPLKISYLVIAFKTSLSIGILLFMASCKSSPEDSAIWLVTTSKQELRAKGFQKMKLDNPFSNKIEEDDDSYYKKYGDTVVQFRFNADIFLTKEIHFNRKLFDSAQLLDNLKRHGFLVIPSKDTIAKFAIKSSEPNLLYDVYVNKREVLMVFGRTDIKIPSPVSITSEHP